MSRRASLVIALLILISAVAADAAVTTVVDTTGGSNTLNPFIGGTNRDLNQGEIVGMSWTQTVSYTNVSIAVSVRSIDPNHSNLTAYLTNAIGPGTNNTNLIAMATVNTFNFSAMPIYPLVTSFTGLTLPAGTYYLTMVGDANAIQGTQNVSDGNATPVLGAGVSLGTLNDQYAAEPSQSFGGPIDDSFPPASTFFFFGRDENGGRLVVQITSGLLSPAIQKQFGASAIPVGGSTSLTFMINNPNSSGTLNSVAFTDMLLSGLTVSNPNGLTGSCDSGTITAVAGTSTVSLSGASLTGGGSCTFSVNVTGATAGPQNNSVTVTSTEGGTGNTANASVE
jgi:hypothetical protein